MYNPYGIHGTNGIFYLHEWLIFMVFIWVNIPFVPMGIRNGNAMRAPKTGLAFTETASPQAVNTLKDARNEVEIELTDGKIFGC